MWTGSVPTLNQIRTCGTEWTDDTVMGNGVIANGEDIAHVGCQDGDGPSMMIRLRVGGFVQFCANDRLYK